MRECTSPAKHNRSNLGRCPSTTQDRGCPRLHPTVHTSPEFRGKLSVQFRISTSARLKLLLLAFTGRRSSKGYRKRRDWLPITISSTTARVRVPILSKPPDYRLPSRSTTTSISKSPASAAAAPSCEPGNNTSDQKADPLLNIPNALSPSSPPPKHSIPRNVTSNTLVSSPSFSSPADRRRLQGLLRRLPRYELYRG